MSRRWLAAPLAALALTAPPALAAPAAPSREVIVIYNGTDEANLRGQNLVTAVEGVLNHLGVIARYHDLRQGLPDAALSARARGVVSILPGEHAPHAEAYAGWLAERLGARQPVVMLGGAAFLNDAATQAPTRPERVEAVFAGLGMRFSGEFEGVPERLSYAVRDAHFNFEAGLPERPPVFRGAASVDAANTVFLKVRRDDTGATSDMGVLGPHGAVLLGSGFATAVNPLSYRLRWRIDPYWLLGRGLGLTGAPALDTTTVNGRRVFFAHIDGDGFANVGNFPGRPLAGTVVTRELLARTPLPTTASVIARDCIGKPAVEAQARALFALPNVEAGSHSYHHPHDWEHGIGTPEGSVGDAAEAQLGHIKQIFTPAVEIGGSVRYIQTLLPPGKRVALMLWSGMTNPTAPFLAACEALGLPNMNGGDALVNPAAPSVAALAPLARQVGPYLQVYTACANENLFTNLWTGPFDGQADALATYRLGGAPRRLAPVNIYYHFYAGERPAGLRALQTLYQWAERQPLAPVFASRYARMVEGFYQGTITPDGPDAWHIEHAGACRTLRFDGEQRVPDLAASRGVAGWNTANGSLYVHLAPGAASRVALGDRRDQPPHLESASAPLQAWKAEPRAIAARFEADAPLSLVLAGFAPGQAVRVSGLAGPARADGQGRLALSGPRGPVAMEVRW